MTAHVKPKRDLKPGGWVSQMVFIRIVLASTMFAGGFFYHYFILFKNKSIVASHLKFCTTIPSRYVAAASLGEKQHNPAFLLPIFGPGAKIKIKQQS